MAITMLLACGFAAALAIFVLLSAHDNQPFKEERSGEVIAERLADACNRLGVLFGQNLPEEGSVSMLVSELSLLAQSKNYYLTHAGALVAGCIASCLAGLLGVFIASSWIGFLIGVAALWGVLFYWAYTKERKRQAEIASQVPDAFRSLASALASGRTLSQAIAYVGSSSKGLLNKEFRKASLKVCCGTSAAEALSELPQNIDAPGISLMVMALQISARTGAPLQSLFTRSAYLSEQRFGLERELRAKTAQVRLSARLVTTLPVVLVFLLVLLSSDYRAGIETQIGTLCVLGAALLDIAALVIIWRLMKGVI